MRRKHFKTRAVRFSLLHKGNQILPRTRVSQLHGSPVLESPRSRGEPEGGASG